MGRSHLTKFDEHHMNPLMGAILSCAAPAAVFLIGGLIMFAVSGRPSKFTVDIMQYLAAGTVLACATTQLLPMLVVGPLYRPEDEKYFSPVPSLPLLLGFFLGVILCYFKGFLLETLAGVGEHRSSRQRQPLLDRPGAEQEYGGVGARASDLYSPTSPAGRLLDAGDEESGSPPGTLTTATVIETFLYGLVVGITYIMSGHSAAFIVAAGLVVPMLLLGMATGVKIARPTNAWWKAILLQLCFAGVFLGGAMLGTVFPWRTTSTSFALAVLLFLCVNELIPEALGTSKRDMAWDRMAASFCFFLGFSVLLWMDSM